MTLWPMEPGSSPGRHSLDPPPTSRAQTDEGGRTGNKSTSLHNSEAVRAERAASFRASKRLRATELEEEAHAVDRQVRRLVRRGIGRIIRDRASELGIAAHPKRELWSRLARRFDSCEYVKAIKNHQTGTIIGFPFSCRVPGCPHCERERVERLRERYLPYVRRARRPHVAYLTMWHSINDQVLTGPGGLAPSWDLIADAWRKLWRSPLFRAVDRDGKQRRCRPGKVGCLAALGDVELAGRRECRSRCARAGGPPHPECRACPGHRPVTAAILALEATLNRRKQEWHPHANLLYDGPDIDQDVLCWAWARALGLPGKAWTWIRLADRPPHGWRGEGWSRDKALFETVKYAVKPDAGLIDPAAPRWYVEWAEARDGRRMVRSVGEWYGLDAEAEDEELDAPAEPTVTIIDHDSGRRYVLPAIDPLTDEPAEWEPLPGDMPRAVFANVKPPGDGRRSWLVTHYWARFGDGDPPDG